MKPLFTLLAFVFCLATAQAQTAARITGRITDSEGKPLNAATVSLLRAKDSSLAKLAVSDKSGQYEFINIKPATYIISFTSVGFGKAYTGKIEYSENAVEVPAVQLVPAAANLASVTVQARRPLVEAKIDKMVVNVDASPTNVGNTALDVLEKSPGIMLDRDGNISLKGKQGVIVLMDGKPTYLNGQDLANLLRNMPASQLDQIEIMTQPSAKFDASGNSGVINLKTKKNTLRGFNGSVNLSYVQGRYPKSPNSFNFNYRKGKVNLFSNLSYSYWEGFNEINLNRHFHDPVKNVDTTVRQQSNMRFSGQTFNARVGLDYSLNKTTSVGFNVNGTYNPRRNDGHTISKTYDEKDAVIGIDEAKNKSRDDWKNLGANINMRKVLKKPGREVTADADLVLYSTVSNQESNNYIFDQNRVEKDVPYLLRGRLPQNITILSAKVDYQQPIGKDAKLEAGVKSSYVETDNNAPYQSFDFTNNVWAADSSADHFVYTEQINAGYVNANRQYKKWGFQLGLRVEYTHSLAHSIKLGTRIPRDYVQPFPTAFVSYKYNDKNTYALSYGRRIERPGYQDLNPFRRILNKETFQQGNPYLTPQFTHNVELSHNYGGKLNTAINYTYTTDIINDIIKQNGRVTFQTKENIATRRNLGIAISYNAPITKWWTTSVYVNVFNNHFKGFVNNNPLDASVTSMMSNMSQQFRFAKTWSAEINGFFRSRSQEGGIMIAEPMGVVSFGIGKQVMKGKGSVKLNFMDPFYMQQFRAGINFGNIDMDLNGRNDTRRVAASFSYRFSKGLNVQQRKRASSAQDEQNRVGGGQQ